VNAQKHDSLLFGCNEDKGLVAAERIERKNAADEMVLFFRRKGKTVVEHDPFEALLTASSRAIENCPVPFRSRKLKGGGALNVCATFSTWKDCLKVERWLSKKTGFSSSAPDAPYWCLKDPVQQYLMTSGRTLFLGMAFGELRRLQLDIECLTTEGYEFCNAEREGDRIAAIALADQTGWVDVISGAELSERELLEQFIATVRERDPDVIEGHNIFNFDLPYIMARAKRHGVKLALGRDGSTPRSRPSRFSAGERTIAYERCEVFGRHILDTLFLVHFYDIGHRSLPGFGLKEVAVHFGIARKDRTYIEGPRISPTFRQNPDKVMRYVRDDVVETGRLSSLLSPSCFIQAQMLPYSYQNICVRGTATKIDALMAREYLRQGYSFPALGRAREFTGGYTDVFIEGIVQNVHHCDVRSLYPSLMLTGKLRPRKDELGIFLKLLAALKDVRLHARKEMLEASSASERTHFDVLQTTFKVFINSFYGYLGFAQARFSDFSMAETVTSRGRSLLRSMIDWLKKHGATPIEIDTDGIYFVPPPERRGGGGRRARKSASAAAADKDMEKFRSDFAEMLPEGIEIEFDGEYESMFSYKMKNYALLTRDGEVIIKGGALKSRGLEPFQRSFLRELIRLRLEGRQDEILALKERYEKAIAGREWPVEKLAKTETLQDSVATYSAKVSQGRRGRSAVYELAKRSGRNYYAGDQLSYYVTGEKKSVTVHEKARLVSEWNERKRDENIPYYLAKIEAGHKKFSGVDEQEELKLGC